ncbi:MAG: aminodeoxychorismate/anthranilate synthase component II [Thermoanaerobaculia bacterium]|nr:aminodeoxychorismate/anthranilate synthase component II [Thermoanaerobaculia bacterium]
MIKVVDNYDSFTWNLVQLIQTLSDAEVEVVRNDAFDVDDLLNQKPQAIVISPGPGTPERAGKSVELAQKNESIPMLGVCLGHQAITVAFGGVVLQGPMPRHGKPSAIRHENRGLFESCPQPMNGVRYHSLISDRDSLPAQLRVDAESDDGIIMGIAHRQRPLFGVQFHPESFGTEGGERVMQNFLKMAGIATREMFDDRPVD